MIIQLGGEVVDVFNHYESELFYHFSPRNTCANVKYILYSGNVLSVAKAWLVPGVPIRL